MICRNRTIVFLVGLAVCSAQFTVASQDPAEWAPRESLLFVGITDSQSLLADLQKTSLNRTISDPSAGTAWSELGWMSKFVAEVKTHLAAALDTEPDQLQNPFSGPAMLCILPPQEGGTGGVEAVLASGVGDAALMRTYHERIVTKLRAVSDKYVQIRAGSDTIDWFTAGGESGADSQPSDPNQDDWSRIGATLPEQTYEQVFGHFFTTDGMPKRLALCLTEDRLIAGSSVEAVRGVLQRASNNDALTKTATYQSLLSQLQPAGSIRLLVDLPGVLKLIGDSGGDDARRVFKLLGADSMTGIVGHWRHGGTEFESMTELMLLIPGERRGLARLLSQPNRPIAPPRTISAESLLYACLNIDAPVLLDELDRMVRAEDPDEADALRARIDAIPLPDGSNLNLRSMLIGPMRGPVTLSLGFRKPYDAQSAMFQLDLAHRDTKLAGELLSKVAELAPGLVVLRELEGHAIYDVPLVGLSITVTSDSIAAGTTSIIDDRFRDAPVGPSLEADPGFQQAARLAHDEAWCVVYADTRRMIEAAIALAPYREAILSASLVNPANAAALGIIEAFTTSADPERIEIARRIADHQAPEILTIQTTPDGIRMRSVQMNPDNSRQQ